MIRVGKVNIEKYLPYSSHRDQLPSEGEALRHPISDNNRPNREHHDHPMIMMMIVMIKVIKKDNDDNCYDDGNSTMSFIHITNNQHIYGDNNNNDDTNLSTIIFIIIINHHHHRNNIIIDASIINLIIQHQIIFSNHLHWYLYYHFHLLSS